jgi:Alpha-L-fucosidase C-terminal domain
VRFTRSKDSKFVYAIALSWPGERLRLKSLLPRPGSTVRLLGLDEPLEWVLDEPNAVSVKVPSRLQEPANRPCQQAYAFRFEATPRNQPH